MSESFYESLSKEELIRLLIINNKVREILMNENKGLIEKLKCLLLKIGEPISFDYIQIAFLPESIEIVCRPDIDPTKTIWFARVKKERVEQSAEVSNG